jgi:hypothetical protein
MSHAAPETANSYNPMNYTPAQLAKALVTLLTSIVAMLGLIAVSFADGPLAAVGGWATAASLVVAPIAVFVTKAAPIIGRFGYLFR